MIVPVVTVLGVTVAVVNVVHVVVVRNGDVAAVRAMLVVVILVDLMLRGLALVPVTLVLAVQVAIVDVIDVVAVRDGDVTTVRAVLVIMIGVGSAAHDELLYYRQPWSHFPRIRRASRLLRRFLYCPLTCYVVNTFSINTGEIRLGAAHVRTDAAVVNLCGLRDEVCPLGRIGDRPADKHLAPPNPLPERVAEY